ncbi:hypothetical protein SAMN04489801_4481 [Pseudomonas mandelii]|uniref:Apea-like HEPN domain-containing protein n=2 Tax=Pseudomonas mandelii TaxID=75612 RepID=A0ABY0VUN0_9PSED|nr:hypothetical protein SAMN04489801_4481 [Pseudomonas mandelii]
MFWDQNDLLRLAAHDFEKYIFISGMQAICNYEDGIIEVLIEPAGQNPIGDVFKKIFGCSIRDARRTKPVLKVFQSEKDGPRVVIGHPSDLCKILTGHGTVSTLSLKISNIKIAHHDETLERLNNIAGALLFQLDLESGVPLVLKRQREPREYRRLAKVEKLPDLKFPTSEFESAPLSLYWYGRSAVGMPLLQFLAFYQVIEFYYPRYAEYEAHRKLKAVLKHPTFRGDRDSDVAKLLNVISVSRSGAFGDERSQLRATLDECLHNDELRRFLLENPEREQFYSNKAKSAYHKVSLAGDEAELRADVARRIYDIRCKIVHTKSDTRDVEVELLLPYSKEADQLKHEIELVQFVAQQVLIAGSMPIGKY